MCGIREDTDQALSLALTEERKGEGEEGGEWGTVIMLRSEGEGQQIFV